MMVAVIAGPLLAFLISVTDGDTFRVDVPLWPDGLRIETSVRVAGIDAPEINGKCPEEKALALAAKSKLAGLLNSGRIYISHVQNDKFAGRVVALVTVDDTQIAVEMVIAGLARPYDGNGARQSWCP